MQKLKIGRSPVEDLSKDEIIETLLEKSGTAGSYPTDEKKLLSCLGLQQMSFDFMAEVESLPNVPANLPKNLRAALHVAERVVATKAGLDRKRFRFSVFHEIAHFVLPWHHALFYVDTEQTMSWWTKIRLEHEANRVAADLLFQADRFTGETVDSELSLRTVLEVAPKYGASYEAAIRRYVERHIRPCAVIVYDKVEGVAEEADPEDQLYGIQYTVTSNSFRQQFFSSVESSEPRMKGSSIFKMQGGWNLGGIHESELCVQGGKNESWRFESELWTNSYKIFQFLACPVEDKAK